jgi:DNA ligase-1
MYKRNTNGSINQWQIIVNGDSFYTEEGQVGGVISQSKPTKCIAKNVGRANWTTAEEQAIAEATAKIKKQKEKGYKEDINNVDTAVDYPPCMLAHKFIDREKEVKYPCLIQPKLDGHRCITRDNKPWTRGHKQHKCIPHIMESLAPIFEKYPDMILDGEIYSHELCNDFNRICSLIKKTKPTYEDLEDAEHLLRYYVYDAPRIGPYTEKDNFLDRYNMLKEVLKDVQYIEIVPTYIVNSRKEIDEYHTKFLADGYEGIMIRINGSYEDKRSKNLLKLKIFDDDEFIINGIIEGKGNKTGMAATVECISKSGEPFAPNIKGPHSLLKKIWNNKEYYIGKKCTVRYFGLSSDKFIPRFPYVIDMDRTDI